MFRIGKLYHVVHVTWDLDACDRWYDEVFGVQRFYKGHHKEAMRDASLICIGDFVMEPLVSSKVPGAESSAIGKFYARFGARLHSIAWYVDSVAEVYEALRRHSPRLYDVAGRPMTATPARAAVYTHPRDSFGALEFALAGNYTPDPRVKPGWSSAYWRDQHPLGIERASHITLLVRDFARARAFYQGVLGGRLLHEEEREGDRRSAFIAVGEDTVVEVAQPLSDDGPTGREFARYNEGVFAVTFKVRDIEKAADFLASKNVRLESRDPDSLVIDRQDAFGAVLGLTQRAIPRDGQG